MTEPTLVIMAAGMGSRFGGLKQVAPVDRAGHPILAFSLYDAWRAGFRQVAFVIKRELETEFRERVGGEGGYQPLLPPDAKPSMPQSPMTAK